MLNIVVIISLTIHTDTAEKHVSNIQAIIPKIWINISQMGGWVMFWKQMQDVDRKVSVCIYSVLIVY